MTYHWTLNGLPACVSPLTLGFSTQCAHPTRESAEQDIEEVRRFYVEKGYPGIRYEIVEGSCGEPDAYSYHEQCGFDCGVSAAIKHADNPDELRRRLIERGVIEDPEIQAIREAERSQEYEWQQKVQKDTDEYRQQKLDAMTAVRRRYG